PQQRIMVSGTQFNDGDYVVAAISSDGRTLTLDLAPDVSLVPESVESGPMMDIVAAPLLSPATGDEAPHLVFSPADHSIRRLDGRSWAADGFAAGQTIVVVGTLSNDGIYRIGSISPDGGTLRLADS